MAKDLCVHCALLYLWTSFDVAHVPSDEQLASRLAVAIYSFMAPHRQARSTTNECTCEYYKNIGDTLSSCFVFASLSGMHVHWSRLARCVLV